MRFLVVLLVVQLVLGAAVIVAATQDFFGLGSDDDEPAKTQAAPTRAADTAQAAQARADRFDADRAFASIERQVALGPRPAGSDASRRLADQLVDELPNGRFEEVPGGLRNIVSTIPGRKPALVVGAHYDTEAVIDNHVGANDGAAGTAAVVELARRKVRPASGRQVTYVLFDGEEESTSSEGLRGSRAYVRAHGSTTGDMVLLDYIANRGARFKRELNSTPALWNRLRRAARDAGAGSLFPPGDQTVAIIDDHEPFLRAGIPAIDVIDFSYRFRDTPEDTPDKLSRRVLDGVGEATALLIRRT